ncbi:hypothetical protein Tco_0509455 [Tanacetum coccineum]
MTDQGVLGYGLGRTTSKGSGKTKGYGPGLQGSNRLRVADRKKQGSKTDLLLQQGPARCTSQLPSTREARIRLVVVIKAVQEDTEAKLKTCPECRVYASIQRAPKHDLIQITAPLTFHQWSIDVCIPFPGESFKTWCETHRIHRATTAPYQSQANGQAANREKLSMALGNEWKNTRLVGWTSSQAYSGTSKNAKGKHGRNTLHPSL